jgi:hypothetical protein
MSQTHIAIPFFPFSNPRFFLDRYNFGQTKKRSPPDFEPA